jgi:ABC-2 type transport system ATP-binding protein
MTEIAIKIINLNKSYTFSAKDENKNFFANLFYPNKKTVQAVDNINLEIKKGERIAFIGPNGAGKSTTIKMLTGILFPTLGEINVLGLNPQIDRKKLAYKIGTVFGQRSQLFPNLPIVDSMHFFGVMYDMESENLKNRIEYLCEILDLNNFKTQPVRKLSLGQRMRGEVACALIHNPEIIFLDEPTIGLDIVAKKTLRELLLKINKEQGTTIFLTSHDVGDIEILCERTVIVNHGKIVKDLPTVEMTKNYIHEKFVDIILANGEKKKFEIDTKKESVSHALQRILKEYEVEDVSVYDVDLETVIREMYEASDF